MPWNPIRQTISAVGDVLNSTGITPEAKRRAEQELARIEAQATQQLQEHVRSVIAQQRDVVVAEVEGQSWMQRNWRPSLMYLFMVILAMQYVLTPILGAFGAIMHVALPGEFWTILTISVTGYLGLRSFEKAAPAVVDSITKKKPDEIHYHYENPVDEKRMREDVDDLMRSRETAAWEHSSVSEPDPLRVDLPKVNPRPPIRRR